VSSSGYHGRLPYFTGRIPLTGGLVQNRDRVVSKDDLIASVWGGRLVSESAQTSRINAARKAVGDRGKDQKIIRTIARKGLRFVSAVQVRPAGDETAPVAKQPPL
jgi:DNA-binding winged helix-turn-helix (wHTH) protein